MTDLEKILVLIIYILFCFFLFLFMNNQEKNSEKKTEQEKKKRRQTIARELGKHCFFCETSLIVDDLEESIKNGKILFCYRCSAKLSDYENIS